MRLFFSAAQLLREYGEEKVYGVLCPPFFGTAAITTSAEPILTKFRSVAAHGTNDEELATARHELLKSLQKNPRWPVYQAYFMSVASVCEFDNRGAHLQQLGNGKALVV